MVYFFVHPDRFIQNSSCCFVINRCCCKPVLFVSNFLSIMHVFNRWLLLIFCLSASLAQAQLSHDQKLEEVYGLHFFDNKPELKTRFYQLLDQRIHYVQEPMTVSEKYPKVSQMGTLSKNNAAITTDAGFDPNTFNPLKYNLAFFSNTTQAYRIDGTDYILVIDPQ